MNIASRILAVVGAPAVALALLGLGSVAQSAPVAAAPATECPPLWEWPGIGGNQPVFLDYNLATYVGGDFSVVSGSAEAEGRTVVRGASLFDRTPPGLFNLGRVGVGSQVAPPPGSNMFMTGSATTDDLTITPGNRIDVGHQIGDGGNVKVGGIVDPSTVHIETNGGTVTQGLGAQATAAYASFGATVRTLSQALGAEPANGSVQVSGNRLTFTGTGQPGVRQVFDVTTAQIGHPTVEINFLDIPSETPVVINVRGTDAYFHPVFFSDDGERVDVFGHPGFPRVAVRTMWNFVDATTLELSGTSQILGSILAMVPANHVEASASTNGRLYVGGDLVLDGIGNELHNYHWPGDGSTVCREIDDDPVPGTDIGQVSIRKVFHGDTALLPDQPWFSGIISCAGPLPGSEVDERWEVRIGQVDVVSGLPVGAQCQVSEIDVSQLPNPGAGLQWSDPQLSPAGGLVTVPPPDDPLAQVTVTVSNSVLGAFDVTKAIEGPGGDSSDFINTGRTFDVDFSCRLGASLVDGVDQTSGLTVPGSSSGTITVGPAAPSTSLLYPIGAQCELQEDITADPGDFTSPGAHWTGVTWAPSSTVTIGQVPSQASATVTNRFEVAAEPVGQFQVSKTVVGPAGPGDPGFINTSRTFPVSFSCTIDGGPSIGYAPGDTSQIVAPYGTGTVDVSADGAPVLSPAAFRLGTECTLSEQLTSDPGDFADPAAYWSDIDFLPSSVFQIVDDVTAIGIEMVNTFSTVPTPLASFSLEKLVAGPAGGFVNPGRVFAVDYGCTLGGDPVIGYDPADPTEVVSPNGTGTMLLTVGTAPAPSPLFPVGTQCVLDEELLRYYDDFADGTYHWAGGSFDPSNVVVVGPEASTLAVTLTNEFDRAEPDPLPFGRFSLLKSLEAPVDDRGEDIVKPDRVFPVSYVCTLSGQPSVGYDGGGAVVSADGTGTIDLLAGVIAHAPYFVAGTECDLSENLAEERDDFDGAFDWTWAIVYPANPIVIDPEATGEARVSVTNYFASADSGNGGSGNGGSGNGSGNGSGSSTDGGSTNKSLADTGATTPRLAALAALLAAAAGAGLLIVRRRCSAH